MGIISEKTLIDLEFFTILKSVSELSISELGKQAILNIRPYTKKEKLLPELYQVNEYLSSFLNDNRIPNHYFDDIQKEIHLLNIENSYLEPVSFLKILNNSNTVFELLKFLKNFKAIYPEMFAVSDKIEFQKTKKSVQAKTVQRLKDIRETQLAHKSVFGTYAPDFDSLSLFINSEVMPVTYNMGSFHDTLPEAKSSEKGYIIKRSDLDSLALVLELERDVFLSLIEEDNSPYKIRDTTFTSFYAENLTQDYREKAKLPLFKLSEMPFNPNTGERFRMKVGVVEIGGLWQPTILVQDPTPFGRDKVKKDTLRFGSTTEAHTDGNWRN